MTDFRNKPSTPEEALKHYGVKGMRWGHRKAEETGGGRASAKTPSATGGSGKQTISSATAKAVAANNSQMKTFMLEAQKMDSKPSEANLMANKQKFLNKFAPDDSSAAAKSVKPMQVPKERRKLTPEQKKLLLKVGVGVGVGVGLYYANKKAGEAMGFTPRVKEHLKKGTLRGKSVEAKEFNAMVTSSQMKTWGVNNYFKGDALTREGFELPAGHTFRRLSQFGETDFTKPTYSVTNKEDWHRYLTNFRHEKGPGASFHEVTWNLTKPVKVPSTKDVLESMRDVLKAEGKEGTEREVMNAYQAISGGGWRDTRSENLVSALKKKGYGAVVDEMDAGVIGDKPLVFFGFDAASPKKSKPLSQFEIDAAEKLVKELSGRRKP